MGHPIVDKVVREGLQSINVSMLSPEVRLKLMTEAGNTLMRMSRFKEAAHAFALAENKEALREHGNWFLKQNKYGLAAHFLLHVEREDRMQRLAQDCIAAGEVEAAKDIYESLGDQVMVHFLRENFKS
jgi:hypothetical protein